MIQNAHKIDAKNAQMYFQKAQEFAASNMLDQAIEHYQLAIRSKPTYLEAYYKLADCYQLKKDFKKAITAYEKAIQLAPNDVDLFACLASALCFNGDLDEAVKTCEKAISLDPNNPTTYFSLSNIYITLGQLDAALNCCNKALEIRADFAPAFHNRGRIYILKNDLLNAENNFLNAVELNPNIFESWSSLSEIYTAQAMVDEAIKATLQAIALDFNQPILHYRAALLLISKDQIPQAVPHLRSAIHLMEQPAPEIWFKLAENLQNLSFEKIDDLMREDLFKLIKLPYIDPTQLVSLFISAAQQDKNFEISYRLIIDHLHNKKDFGPLIESTQADGFLGNPLFLETLKRAPVKGPLYEIIFTTMRKNFLEFAINDRQDVLTRTPVKRFLNSLAVQCFFTEFVYWQSESETDFVSGILLNKVKQILETPHHSRTVYQNSLVALLACYMPLHKLEHAEKLLEGKLPNGLEDVLTEQIQHPLTEQGLRSKITQLTPIDNEISQAVKNMYEENPYPRWVGASISPLKYEAKFFFQNVVPYFNDKPLCFGQNVDMLIAGCGSGKHPVQSGTFFANTNVVAIDLSMTSLAYAMRKTREYNLENISYGQADILQLENHEKRYDLIESAGVLHHLQDPMKGWKILVGLLKPQGIMRVGLYSETARQHIVKIREHIQKLGYTTQPQDIRKLRHMILNEAVDPALAKAANNGDFYTLSECRDLLFHVQEHRFTIPKIKQSLKDLGLEFAGFDLPKGYALDYKNQYPDDTTFTNLDNWEKFEQDHPDMFMGMYQFWTYKP